jgi:ketosteroid isomerase-like protein
MAAARELIERVIEAFNARRLDRLAALLAVDSELVSPRGTVQGPDAIRAYWRPAGRPSRI